jgi:hypothetical protein
VFLFVMVMCIVMEFITSGCSLLCLWSMYFRLTRIADMLPGFKEGQEKMSKSDPSSAIFMEDDEVYISHEIFFLLHQHSFVALASCDT